MGSAIRIGLESVHGTIATTFKSVPCAFKGKLNQANKIPAEGRMGQDVQFAVIAGVQDESFDISESPVYHDTFGIFLAMALGAPTKAVIDTIFDNTFKLADDPKSATVQWDQPHRSTSPFQTLYNVIDQLVISFDVNGDLTYSASGASMPETVISVPAYAFSTARPFAGWACAVTKAGAEFANLIKGKITIKRNRKPFHAFNNTQAPTKMTIGDRLVTFDLEIDFASTAEYAQWKNATTDALVLKFEDAGATIGTTSKPALTLTMSSCAYTEAEIDADTELPEIKIKGGALYNVADASALVAILRSSIDYTTL